MEQQRVPQSLRRWFLVHFVVDVLFAIPLLFFPNWFLEMLMVPNGGAVTARLVGAALIGIGGASLFAYKKSYETYDILLTMKILWSLSAILSLLLAFWTTLNMLIWLFVAIFVVFGGIWIYYKLGFRK